MTPNSWTHNLCESCLKNAHKKCKMIKRLIHSGDIEGKYSREVWVCSECGYLRTL